MARRTIVEDDEHLERWLISYADFITLLMAFFVVMYSISAVNVGKYRILSETLSKAFNTPVYSVDPLQTGELAKRIEAPGNPDFIVPLENVSGAEGDVGKGKDDTLETIRGQMTELFQDLIDNNQISVEGDELWVEIELASSLLFQSGSAELSPDAEIIFDQVGQIIRDYPNPVHVEGFTDDRPIRTEAYPTNWELSSARSSAIVRLLADLGVAPERMAAVGYAQYQPVGDNSTEEGRQQNRRVVIVISRNPDIQRSVAALGSDRAANVKRSFLDLEDKVGESQIQRGLRPGQPPVPPPPAEEPPPATTPEAPRGIPEGTVSTPQGELRTLRLPSGGLLFTRQPEEAPEAAPAAPGNP